MRINASLESIRWAREEFGGVRLGDVRRRDRLVAMAACAADRPHGRVAAVFETEKEREGAYDFLESAKVDGDELVASMARATCERAAGMPFVYVPVDGTSLSVVDRAGTKDLGRLGSDRGYGRGLKVIDALAVAPDGVPLGWLALTYWARPSAAENRPPPKGSQARKSRSTDEKETRYWLETLRTSTTVLEQHGLRAWFQLDREADNRDLLLALVECGHWWTVRARGDRSIDLDDGGVGALRTELKKRKLEGAYTVQIPPRPHHPGREAQLELRFGEVRLRLRDRQTNKITLTPVTVVCASEVATPEGVEPLEWLLFTNRQLETAADGLAVVRGYAQRWRVEEAHRSWKSGACNVEETQLQSFRAVKSWATLLAATAVRIERMKRIPRTNPTARADVELTRVEVRALVILRRQHYPRERVPDKPSLLQAVAWIAEIGGYAGRYSGKPPGATVLSRGLSRLTSAAELLHAAETQGILK